MIYVAASTVGSSILRSRTNHFVGTARGPLSPHDPLWQQIQTQTLAGNTRRVAETGLKLFLLEFYSKNLTKIYDAIFSNNVVIVV